MWGLLRENSRLIEQFTSLAAAAGPLDNTDQLLQQVIVGFFSQFLFGDFESISNQYGNSKSCENGERHDDVPICHLYLVAKCSAVFLRYIFP